MSKLTVMDRVKLLPDVAKELNIDFDAIHAGIMQLPMPEKDKLNMIADYNWEKIIEALNEGWLADYADYNQDKYWPYAVAKKDESDPSGFGFSYTLTIWSRADASVGARLLCRERAVALYAINQFPAEYKAAILARRGK